MNDLPIHYVYKHVDPTNGDLTYIGHGKFERAWRCSTSGNQINYGHRSVDYSEKILGWLLEGFTPNDWVTIIQGGLSKSSANKLEQELIRELNPIYNKRMGQSLLKMSSKELEFCQHLRSQNFSYENIAKRVGHSTMCVWRALNGKNKNAPNE